MNESVSLSDDILFRRVADEGVVVDQKYGKVIVVNETAVRILELIRELGSIDSVVTNMAREYDVAPELIESDVVNILNHLKNASTED